MTTVNLTIDDLKKLLGHALRNGTLEHWAPIALQFVDELARENTELRRELSSLQKIKSLAEQCPKCKRYTGET